jgi:hypothetical protein
MLTSRCGAHTLQVDRKNNWRHIQHVTFPQRGIKGTHHLTDTVLDGEYVVDMDPVTGVVSAHADPKTAAFIDQLCATIGWVGSSPFAASASAAPVRLPSPERTLHDVQAALLPLPGSSCQSSHDIRSGLCGPVNEHSSC